MMPHLAKDHQRRAYTYELPSELIAQRPCVPRDHSRLLVYDQSRDKVYHTHFYELAQFLVAGSTLVFNESKVFACRLKASKLTGGQAEIFFLKPIEGEQHEVLIRCSGNKKSGQEFIAQNCRFKILQRTQEGHFLIESQGPLKELLSTQGQVPIPPYIRNGESDTQDLEDYQTMFAKNIGSVAAPTAGLHFTDRTFATLKNKAVTIAKVNLHVGAGTFAPVKTNDIREHQMHSEQFMIPSDELKKLQIAKRIVAVGSTSMRTIESSYQSLEEDWLAADAWHATRAFLYPGQKVKKVTDLLTNFHLPESTLIMLVASLIGREKTLELYRLAVEKRYRFFSYGDAMLILRGKNEFL